MKFPHVIRSLVFVAILAAGASSLRATPVTLSYEDAHALFGALTKVKAGLTPSNVGFAATDVFILKGFAESFEESAQHFSFEDQRANSAKDPITAKEEAAKKWSDFRHTQVTVDLVPLNLPLTDEEIKTSELTPDLYALIQHYLAPVTKK